MTTLPTDLRFSKDHEWARRVGELIEVGITTFAVEQLGDITLVELVQAGSEVALQDRFGDVESVKSVSGLFAPVGGTVAEINTALHDAPELVNDAPYEAGWMVRIRPNGSGDFDALMDATAYTAYCASLDH